MAKEQGCAGSVGPRGAGSSPPLAEPELRAMVTGGPAQCSLPPRSPGSPPSLSALGASTGSWLQGSHGLRANQIHLHSSHYPVSPISSRFFCTLGEKPTPAFSEVDYTSAEGLALPFPICHPSFSTKESSPSFLRLISPVHPPDLQGSTVVLFFIHASGREKHPQSSLLVFFKIFRFDSHSRFDSAAPRAQPGLLSRSSVHLHQSHALGGSSLG